MEERSDNWFKEWFDSDHYHLLYDHRNDIEAEEFIKSLFDHLQLPIGSKVLDLACGKGRHALQVHNLGYDVLGVDLSEESINHARLSEEDGLRFKRGDMRDLKLNEQFDVTLNLFTSFGYFKKKGENSMVLKGLAGHLKNEGRIILDYLNVNKALHDLPCHEVIQKNGIEFKIKKEEENNFIVKNISFKRGQEDYSYKEYVKSLKLADFEAYFAKLNMKIEEIFGDYQLSPYNESKSDRLIMIAKFI